MRLFAILSALVAIPAAVAANAQDEGDADSRAPERESQLTVFGNDPCPPSVDGEIVVCARRPEEERYRIPPGLRQTRPTEVAWGSRVAELEETSRIGRPNSCSVVGVYGQGGCTQALIRDWYAERRARNTRP